MLRHIMVLSMVFPLCAPLAEAGKKGVGDIIRAESERIKCKSQGENQPRICPDSSFSWEQPDYGICGSVAVANLLAHFNVIVSPLKIAGGGLDKSLNGTNQRQVEVFTDRRYGRSLNLDFDREELDATDLARLAYHNRAFKFQKKKFNPVLVALRVASGQTGHVTTVVGLEQTGLYCQVRHNSWSDQFITPCDIFARLMHDEDAVYIAGRS